MSTMQDIKLKWADIGVNLTDSSFDQDRNEVIANALSAGVEQMLVTGTTLEESLQAIELCQQYPEQLHCTVGIHPHYAKDHSPADFRTLLELSAEESVLACGEMGLDFNRNFSPPEQQIKCFEAQLEVASHCQLPLFLHERDAHKTQLEILKHHRDDLCGGVAHCFTGTKEALFNYLDLDLYIGITGWICDERRGSELRELVQHIPTDRLLLETDAPYLIPRNLKPKPKSRRNLPEYLPHIASHVAQLRQQSIESLAQQVWANTQRLFTFAPTD